MPSNALAIIQNTLATKQQKRECLFHFIYLFHFLLLTPLVNRHTTCRRKAVAPLLVRTRRKPDHPAQIVPLIYAMCSAWLAWFDAHRTYSNICLYINLQLPPKPTQCQTYRGYEVRTASHQRSVLQSLLHSFSHTSAELPSSILASGHAQAKLYWIYVFLPNSLAQHQQSVTPCGNRRSNLN